jgi:acyl dehydratase
MRYFEDYIVGQVLPIGEYELTTHDIISFAEKWDPQFFHLDEEKAKASLFGGLTASGCHLLAITIRLIMHSQSQGAALAALGWDEVRFTHPARPGDRLSLTVECRQARPSRSKPDRGIIHNHYVLKNEEGQVVLSYTATILVQKRSC